MNVFVAFLFFALGVATDAMYNKLRKVGEYEAYKDGQRQAQKEEKIRIDAMEKAKSECSNVPVVNADAYIFAPQYKENHYRCDNSSSRMDDWNGVRGTITRIK